MVMRTSPAFVAILLPLAALACNDKTDSGLDSDPQGDSSWDSQAPDTGGDSVPDTGGDSEPVYENPAIESCGDGTTGFISEPERAVHVWADAEEGGDGSWAHPLTDISDALELTRVLKDKRIAIWPGVYTDNLSISLHSGDDDTIIQACSPDEVTLQAEDSSAPVIVANEATGVEIAGLCTEGGTRGIQIWGDASLYLNGVCATGATAVGLLVLGNATQAVLEDVEIRGSGAKDGLGYGIAIQEGATVDMQGGGVWDASTVGVLVDDATEVSLSGVTVEGTLADADGSYGHGLQVQNDTVEVTVQDASFANNQGAGVHVLQGLGFTMAASSVSATAASAIPDSKESTGDGVVISRGEGNLAPAQFVAEISDCVIEGSERAGIVLDGVTAMVSDNVLSGNGHGDDTVLAQDSAIVSGSDTVTTLADDEALALNLSPADEVDVSSN